MSPPLPHNLATTKGPFNMNDSIQHAAEGSDGGQPPGTDHRVAERAVAGTGAAERPGELAASDRQAAEVAGADPTEHPGDPNRRSLILAQAWKSRIEQAAEQSNAKPAPV
jgi:hypothetical protein